MSNSPSLFSLSFRYPSLFQTFWLQFIPQKATKGLNVSLALVKKGLVHQMLIQTSIALQGVFLPFYHRGIPQKLLYKPDTKFCMGKSLYMATRANAITFKILGNELSKHSAQDFLGALLCLQIQSRFSKGINYIHFVNALTIWGFIGVT